jgi:predicted  nucleic acid-binding Zn-ribbon protein
MSRRRHRVPTIFSVYMLDMLYGSLGAIILLMLIYAWGARQQASDLNQERERIEKASAALAKAQQEYERTQQELAGVRTHWQQAQEEVRNRQSTLEKLRGQLAAQGETLRQTQAALEKMRQERDATAGQLKSAQQGEKQSQTDMAKLRQELAEKSERLADLTKLLDSTQKERDKAAGQSTTMEKDLEKAKARASGLEADLLKLQQQLKDAGIRLEQAQKDSQATKLDAATLRKLLDEQQAASGRLRQDLTVAQSRFAGIDLSGKRVVFLIDMSGSMGAVDSQTLSPQKWPEVSSTAAQVLKSLPYCERFQVIIFSDEVRYLLGQPGQWLVNDRNTSAETVRQALLKVKPDGNTALYAAFEEAFRFRSQDLDTIFLLSDGLPNIGPGLPPNPPRDEASQAALLSKHLLDTIRNQWNRNTPKVKIHSIGFFYESPNLGAFLWALSRESGGSFVGMSKP